MSQTTLGIIIAVLAVIWVALFYISFQTGGATLVKMFAFLGLLVVTGILAYLFYVRVLGRDPDPQRIAVARRLVDDKAIFLNDIVPGMPADLDYIQRLDTDQVEERIPEEWLAYYRYDATGFVGQQPLGPFGAAIYDYDECRPPQILSWELVPVDYDYLGLHRLVTTVENIIPYADPLSGGRDLPEVIINGYTYQAVTDLNIFRRIGVPLNCDTVEQWRDTHPANPCFPNPLRYENIGSFRGNYRVARNGDTVSVMERSPFERSEIVIVRVYRPENGSYFVPGTQTLLRPVEYTLALGPGLPLDVPQVYYPEKAVLSFYSLLTQNEEQLERARSFLSPDAQAIYDIETDPFGLYLAPGAPIENRAELARVLVWEIAYDPDVEAERLRRPREVTVTVVGVDTAGNIDYAHPCIVTWTVVGVVNPNALPYGCEWRLETYTTNCVVGK
ncbi:MAG TPA: hypothetical protein VLC95_17930 [Anaerolineae bacterium]|jgi:hypothetical protein|nr:hypothetical protein [Anaerolineae bacterium]